MKSAWIKIGLALLVVMIIIVARWMGVGSSLSLEYFIEQRDAMRLFIENNYMAAVCIYLSTMIVTIILAIPGSLILTIAGGLFFGTILGTLYATIGATIGATLSFLLFRYLLGSSVAHFYPAMLEKFDKAFEKHGSSYLLFMQLLPVTPFSVITVVAGLSHVSVVTFIWTTFVGIFPGSFIYAYAGSHFNSMKSTDSILSWPLIFALVALAGMALLPLIIEKFRDA